MPSSNPAARSLKVRDALEAGIAGEEDLAIEDIEKEVKEFHHDNYDRDRIASNQITNENDKNSEAEENSMCTKKKPKYGRTKDNNPDEITMDDFNQKIIKEKKMAQDNFNKKTDWDAKIDTYHQRREIREARRRAELKQRAWERRKAAMRYVFTGQWMNFSAKCKDKCKCCGKSTTTIICIIIVVAVVVGTPIVITVFTGGLA
mmetsp:Transcript_27038/g.37739  ORF Transcript_27038/g.37739 Transcript_27038/m.37739 type:complete len:203 (+) Transcript_27038:113-721(+)|eukprot:CAMPEP_0185266474 /NCGR_PEP_ID=MMETSP1359-20130426/31213_1 /TAXON_ID=552665 /ORGANISM="Bigelowiella longifila, Strain CCMP242" /LENGTH=202 /DNA_ID=CAMNT_0027856303 /DNA_START=61 /DNA_END=669 /DNA_ORIENTATION=-